MLVRITDIFKNEWNWYYARVIFSPGNEYNDPRRIYTDLVEKNINGWIDIHQLTSAAGSIGMVGVFSSVFIIQN